MPIKKLAVFFLYLTAASIAVSISLFEIISSIFIALAFLCVWKEKKAAFFKDPWLIFLGVYFAVNLISWSGSGYFYESFRGVFRVFRCVGLCLSAAYVVDSEERLKSLLRFFLICATVVGLDAVIQGLTTHELLRHRQMAPYLLDRNAYRVTGPFPHPTDFSAYLSFILLLFWGVITGAWSYLKKWERGLFLGGFIAALTSLMWTYSRGAWGAAAIGFIAWILLKRSKIGLIFLLLLGLWGALLAPEPIKMRLNSFAQWNDGTMTERRLLWGEALSMIRDKPWFGFGPNTYSKIEPYYKPKDSRTDSQYAHNSYLHIGAEIGLLGLLSFLGVIFYCVASSARALLRSKGGYTKAAGLSILFGIFSFSLHAITDTDFQSLLLVNLLWFSLGLVWASKSLSEKQNSKEEIRLPGFPDVRIPGYPDTRIPGSPRILYIRTDRIGDTLMNLPAIHLLRQSYPKAWITLLLNEEVSGLLQNHPDVDEILTQDSLSAKKLKRIQFDMAVIANPDKAVHWKVFLAGIPVRVGHDQKCGILLTHRLKKGQDRSRTHEFKNNLDLVSLVCDQDWDGLCKLPMDESAAKRIDERLRKENLADRLLVAVHAGSSNPAKRWPREKFAELINRILESGRHEVILIGGKEEAGESRQLLQQVREPVKNWTGQLTLQELAAFFRQSRVRGLVSSDSGPVHVAWMSGTPVVAFYAKNDPGSTPERWGPRDGKSIAIHKYMNEITVGEVYEALQKILEKN